jgi:hypothetical protein
LVSILLSLGPPRRGSTAALPPPPAAARGDAKRLHEKIDGAKARLEGLLSRLPG